MEENKLRYKIESFLDKNGEFWKASYYNENNELGGKSWEIVVEGVYTKKSAINSCKKHAKKQRKKQNHVSHVEEMLL